MSRLLFLIVIFAMLHRITPAVEPYSSTGTVTAWKKPCFILSERSDFQILENLSAVISMQVFQQM